MFVLDTNSLIYFFKGMGNIVTKLLNTPPVEIGIPSIVIYELEVGIAKSTLPEKRTAQLASLISIVHILPFGIQEAKAAAGIRASLENQGHPIGPYDILIAATAMVNNGTLITRNSKEFERIPNLQIDDWF